MAAMKKIMAAMKGFAVGQVVHFDYPDYTGNPVGGVYPLKCHAAIITRVLDDEKGTVNLQWFDDVARNVARNVRFNVNKESGPAAENSWHWPEQV